MKQIIDTDGSYRYRKIETRLIVSRPDQNNADGTAKAQTALFGTYQWNDDESRGHARRRPSSTTACRSGTRCCSTTPTSHSPRTSCSGNPTDPENALLTYDAARHYAIPSSQRCIQCHMGSPSQAFVLGFTPLQINRVPTGSHGVIEETGPDELTSSSA